MAMSRGDLTKKGKKESGSSSNLMDSLAKGAKYLNPLGAATTGAAVGKAIAKRAGKVKVEAAETMAKEAGEHKGYVPTATEKDRMMELGMKKRAAGARVIGAKKPGAAKPSMPTKKPMMMGSGMSDMDKKAKMREKEYETSRDRHGDYYLAMSGGFGSEPYKKPRKR